MRLKVNAQTLCQSAIGLAVVVGLSACAGDPDPAANDPLRGLNESILSFNDGFDTYIFEPVVDAYEFIVPEPFRESVSNLLNNARVPASIVNDILQGDFLGAQAGAERFLTNSVLGVGGLFDVYSLGDNPRPFFEEDFGQTLAVWGIDEGPYLVLPFLGPSSTRDTVGFALNTVTDPVGLYFATAVPFPGSFARSSATIFDLKRQAVDELSNLRETSIDYYASLRSLYRQFRQSQIDDGGSEPTVDIPEFDEEIEPPSE